MPPSCAGDEVALSNTIIVDDESVYWIESLGYAGGLGAERQLFDDVYFVSGSVTIKAPVPMTFSCNMTVVRDGDSLTFIDTMRLDEAGLLRASDLFEVHKMG
jgi:hypothetical protein